MKLHFHYSDQFQILQTFQTLPTPPTHPKYQTPQTPDSVKQDIMHMMSFYWDGCHVYVWLCGLCAQATALRDRFKPVCEPRRFLQVFIAIVASLLVSMYAFYFCVKCSHVDALWTQNAWWCGILWYFRWIMCGLVGIFIVIPLLIMGIMIIMNFLSMAYAWSVKFQTRFRRVVEPSVEAPQTPSVKDPPVTRSTAKKARSRTPGRR